MRVQPVCFPDTAMLSTLRRRDGAGGRTMLRGDPLRLSKGLHCGEFGRLAG
jgi:hypothetical protein